MKKLKKSLLKSLWKHEQLYRNSFKVSSVLERNKNWERFFLLTSDQHWDNPSSDRKLQIKHLNQARERQASVISAGDYFCLMQGKYDKRGHKGAIRPEHNKDNYIDAVIDDATEFIAPYADLFVFIATGNHEQAIENRSEINIIERFSRAVYEKTGHVIWNGGYSGYLTFNFKNASGKGFSHNTIMKYAHGTGGGAPVTGGIIDSFRQAAYYRDADIYLSGHTHDSFAREIETERFNAHTGQTKLTVHTQIKCPSYKKSYKDGWGGWETAKMGMPPKPIGAYWLRFYYESDPEAVCYEVIKAS